MRGYCEEVLDQIHNFYRHVTGNGLVSDLHERPLLGLYPPLDPKLTRRLEKIRDAGVLFIHIPKNAGMSVSSILYDEQVFHPTVRYYQRVAPDIVRDLPSFAIWRDPVERFLSGFRYARSGGHRDAPVSRAFRKQYQALHSLDDALCHVEGTSSLYRMDHIFRPQFWYVADGFGRIAVDRICLIEDLDRVVAEAQLPGLESIGRINPSPPIDVELSADQLARLRALYAIDFAIYEALRSETLPSRLKARCAA